MKEEIEKDSKIIGDKGDFEEGRKEEIETSVEGAKSLLSGISCELL